MIATLSEIKTLIQKTDSAQDALISMMIPIATQHLVDITNNAFTRPRPLLNYDYIYSKTLTFSKDAKTITDASTGIAGLRIAAGGDILVQRSLYNNGHFTVKELNGNVITVEDVDELKDETPQVQEPNEIILSAVEWPKALKLVFAKMIEHLIDPESSRDGAKTSETIGSHSVSFFNDNTTQLYPAYIMRALRSYTAAGVK
jgi:hypothetical protein